MSSGTISGRPEGRPFFVTAPGKAPRLSAQGLLGEG